MFVTLVSHFSTHAQASPKTKVQFFLIFPQLKQGPRFDQRKWSGLYSNMDRCYRSRMLYQFVSLPFENQCFLFEKLEECSCFYVLTRRPIGTEKDSQKIQVQYSAMRRRLELFGETHARTDEPTRALIYL